MRRIILIIILVIIGAITGGIIGVGAAYYLIKQNLESINTGVQAEAPQPKVDTVITKVVEEVKMETKKKNKPVGGDDTARVQAQALQAPVTQQEYQGQTIVVPEQPQEPQQSPQLQLSITQEQTQTKSSQTLPEVKAPTIDLGSSNISVNVDLNKPSKPSTSMPDISPTISSGSLSLSVETLKEEDVKKVYYDQGNIAKAEKMVNDALSKNPNDQVAKKYARIIKLEKNALSLEAQGDMEGAKRIWKEILSIDPNHPRAKAKGQ